MATGAYHFRCNNCQSLEHSDHAGERDLPLKCRVCGKGAHYIINDAGAPEMVQEPENWTVLADLSTEDLAPILDYHKIDASEIGRHEPFVTTVARDEHNAIVTNLRQTVDSDGNPAVDAAGAPIMAATPVHTRTLREGPMVEPAQPQFIEATASEGLGTTDTVESSASASEVTA